MPNKVTGLAMQKPAGIVGHSICTAEVMGAKTVINLRDGPALALSWGVSMTSLNLRLDFKNR